MLALSVPALAQPHVAGQLGFLTRIDASRFDFPTFREGPSSARSILLGAAGGIPIWKVVVDGNVQYVGTGLSQSFIAPARSIKREHQGRAVFVDAGAAWPFWKWGNRRLFARAGYGVAWVDVATEIPIDDRKPFWTASLGVDWPVYSRFMVRVEVKDFYFRKDKVPPSLGRHNVTTLFGFGMRF